MQRRIAKHYVELATYHGGNFVWNSEVVRIANKRVSKAVLLGFGYLEGLNISQGDEGMKRY